MLQQLVTIFAVITIGASTGFIKVPQNLTVPTGSSTIAPFFCQHQSADDIIWIVNGSSLHQLHVPEITACSNTLPNRQRIDKLKIDVRPEYNGTSVVCAAVFFSGVTADESDPAELTILDSAPALPTSFIKTPNSLVTAIGERAIFCCQHCTANFINWYLNETLIPSSNLPEGIYINYIFPDDALSLTCGGVYSLIIADVVAYNTTIIQCEANIDGGPNEASNTALLLTQGQLGQVTNLRRNFSLGNLEFVVYEWDPPFSLNVTNADPDVAYCVHIYNVTCPMQKRITLLENCTITEPTFLLTKNLGAEEIYEIEVIARTYLDVAFNENVSATYRDKFVFFNHTLVKYNITVITDIHVEVLVELYLQGFDPSSVIPNEIEVQLFDAYSLNDITYGSVSNITCPTALLSATMSHAHFNLNCSMPLEIRRLFLSTINIPTASCTISNSSCEIELSTHLIQNIRVTSLLYDQSSYILVSGDLLDADIANITALGFLAIAYSNRDLTSLQYGIATPLSESNSDKLYAEVVLPIKSSSKQQYRVSVFSIKHDGLPLNKSVNFAQPAIADSNITRNVLSTNSNPKVHASYRDGCVQCYFLDRSSNSCIVITSAKSQINSNKGITIIEVFNFARKGNEAYYCINKSINDFDIVVFTFDKTLARISGPGVAVELSMDRTTTATTISNTNIHAEANGTHLLIRSQVIGISVSVLILIILIVVVILSSIVVVTVVHKNIIKNIKVHDVDSEAVLKCEPDAEDQHQGGSDATLPNLESDTDAKAPKLETAL